MTKRWRQGAEVGSLVPRPRSAIPRAFTRVCTHVRNVRAGGRTYYVRD